MRAALRHSRVGPKNGRLRLEDEDARANAQRVDDNASILRNDAYGESRLEHRKPRKREFEALAKKWSIYMHQSESDGGCKRYANCQRAKDLKKQKPRTFVVKF